VVVGGLGGRLDHDFANLSAAMAVPPSLHVTFVRDSRSIASVLRPGVHWLVCALPRADTGIAQSIERRDPRAPASSLDAVQESLAGLAVGLVPLSGPTAVTTHGLRWDLSSARLEMGGLVSSSNRPIELLVKVETDRPLLWTLHSHESPLCG
jgi:thiamine pyrophosphokinase